MCVVCVCVCVCVSVCLCPDYLLVATARTALPLNGHWLKIVGGRGPGSGAARIPIQSEGD